MGSPLVTRQAVLAAKIESTAYVAEPLVAADSNFNIFNPSATPGLEMQDRPAMDSFSMKASTVGLRPDTISFVLDVHGNGVGSTPPWADTFLPACGLVKTGDVWAPVTGLPYEGTGTDNGVRTLTIALFEGNRRKMLTGAMGNVRFVNPTGKNAFAEFTFQGCWTSVIDSTILQPTYPSRAPFRFAATTFTIGGYEPCVSEFAIDLGNAVQMRECQKNANASGYRGAFIGDRKIGGTLDPEARLVADFDTHGNWINAVEQAMSCALSDADDTMTFAMPKLQLNNVAPGDRNGLRTDQLTFQANRDAAPDDEFTLTFG